eukprot:403341837
MELNPNNPPLFGYPVMIFSNEFSIELQQERQDLNQNSQSKINQLCDQRVRQLWDQFSDQIIEKHGRKYNIKQKKKIQQKTSQNNFQISQQHGYTLKENQQQTIEKLKPILVSRILDSTHKVQRDEEVRMKSFTFGFKLDGSHFDKVEDLEYQLKKNGGKFTNLNEPFFLRRRATVVRKNTLDERSQKNFLKTQKLNIRFEDELPNKESSPFNIEQQIKQSLQVGIRAMKKLSDQSLMKFKPLIDLNYEKKLAQKILTPSVQISKQDRLSIKEKETFQNKTNHKDEQIDEQIIHLPSEKEVDELEDDLVNIEITPYQNKITVPQRFNRVQNKMKGSSFSTRLSLDGDTASYLTRLIVKEVQEDQI